MIRVLDLFFLTLVVVGCSSGQEILRPEGRKEEEIVQRIDLGGRMHMEESLIEVKTVCVLGSDDSASAEENPSYEVKTTWRYEGRSGDFVKIAVELQWPPEAEGRMDSKPRTYTVNISEFARIKVFGLEILFYSASEDGASYAILNPYSD